MKLYSKILSRFSVLLFLMLLLSASSVSAQSLRNFTTDPVKFINEMQGFLAETDKHSGEQLMEEFIPVWNSGKFSAAQQETIYKTCNTMLRKRMKAFPDFKNYLVTLVSFAKSTQSDQSFASWQTSIDKLLLMPSKYFTNYITTCFLLFRDNTFYESSAVRWYATVNNYQFGFDSLPLIKFPVTDLVCVSKGDSSVIGSTSGILYPTRSLFSGNNGKVNWLRGGYDLNTVRAELNTYTIDITGRDFSADSALFYYSTTFYSAGF